MCDIIRSVCVEVFLILRNRLKMQKMCNEAVKLDSCLFYKVPGKFLTIEMCQNAVKDGYWHIKDVPDWLKTAEMCNGVVKDEASFLGRVPDRFKTQGMCNEAVRRKPYTLGHVPDHFKIEKMCNKAVEKNPWSLVGIPDWFLTHQKICQVMKLIMAGVVCFRIMMMILLSGIMVIKNARLKKSQSKKSSYLLLGIHQDGGIGVFLMMIKKRQKNCF